MDSKKLEPPMTLHRRICNVLAEHVELDDASRATVAHQIVDVLDEVLGVRRSARAFAEATWGRRWTSDQWVHLREFATLAVYAMASQDAVIIPEMTLAELEDIREAFQRTPSQIAALEPGSVPSNDAGQAVGAGGATRRALQEALYLCCAIPSFLGRDRGTNRIEACLDGLEKVAFRTEPLIRAALTPPEPVAAEGVRKLVEHLRMRSRVINMHTPTTEMRELVNKAADTLLALQGEIERLKAEVVETQVALGQMVSDLAEAQQENVRLTLAEARLTAQDPNRAEAAEDERDRLYDVANREMMKGDSFVAMRASEAVSWLLRHDAMPSAERAAARATPAEDSLAGPAGRKNGE